MEDDFSYVNVAVHDEVFVSVMDSVPVSVNESEVLLVSTALNVIEIDFEMVSPDGVTTSEKV